MKKFLAPLLTAGTMLALLYTVYGYREQNEKLKNELNTIAPGFLEGGDIEKAKYIDSLTNLIDSLHDEAFISNNTLGRYEISLQNLEEVNPKAAKQFNDFLTNETE
jgi:hypothetical protein